MFLWRRPLILLCPNNESNFRVDTIKVAFVILHAHQSYMAHFYNSNDIQKSPTESEIQKEFCYRRPVSLWKLRAPSDGGNILMANKATDDGCCHPALTYSWEVSTSARSPLHITDLIARAAPPAHEIWTIVSRLSRLAFWCRNYNLTIIASAFSFLMSRFHSWDRQRASNPVAWPEKYWMFTALRNSAKKILRE